LFRLQLGPGDFAAARVFHAVGADSSHAVNSAQYVRFPELRRRTTQFVPAACIDHQQAPVGVHQYVRRVKVHVLGADKVAVLADERTAGGVFATIGWWKQTDPLRESRLRILSVITALIVAGMWLLPGVGLKLMDEPFDAGQFPWPFVVPAMVSLVVQLSAPWMSPQERAEIRQRVLSGGRV
jgi:hypothetical protein